MRIGRQIREVEEVPKPIRIPRTSAPAPEREKVTVPVRRKEDSGRGSLTIEPIPYECPICGRELVLGENSLYCPTHGLILSVA